MRVEIQVRSAAQHIWAAASHSLQYKKEELVPKDLARAINRVSALLETVDLEFERVLVDRESYSENVETSDKEQVLNVELLRKMLDERLPEKNKGRDEDYGEMLTDLQQHGINTVGELDTFIKNNLHKALAREAFCTDEGNFDKVEHNLEEEIGEITIELSNGETLATDRNSFAEGVFLSHQGFVNYMISSDVHGMHFDPDEMPF